MRETIKAVLFDFNGTMLYDTPIHEAVWLDFIPTRGGRLGSREEYCRHLFGCTNRHILTHYLPGLSEADIARLSYEKEAEYRRRCVADDQVFHLVDGLPVFLDALKARNVPMTIATGSEFENVDFYFKSPKLGLTRWFRFDQVVYDDGTLPGKPAPDIYRKAAEKIGFDCRDCAVFEDSYAGVAAARAAGAKYVIALGGSQKETFDGVGGVDMSVSDFRDFASFPGFEWLK